MLPRRQFLRSTALAGVALSTLRPQAAFFPQEKPKRVGVIGCGWYGKCDLFRLIQVAPVEVVSLCDVDKQRRATALAEVLTEVASAVLTERLL